MTKPDDLKVETVPKIEHSMHHHAFNVDGTVRRKHCCGCWIINHETLIAECNECGEVRNLLQMAKITMEGAW